MDNTVRIQEWSNSLSVGERGVELVVDLLHSFRETRVWYQTVNVLSLVDDSNFQRLGIDLVWFVIGAGCTCALTIEVKADQNEHTGNFFFETISDIEKNSPGAFLASTAEWYVYVFPGSSTVYCLPLDDTRRWFRENVARFAERTARSHRSGRRWNTQGRLVPVAELLGAVTGVRVFQKSGEHWAERRGR